MDSLADSGKLISIKVSRCEDDVKRIQSAASAQNEFKRQDMLDKAADHLRRARLLLEQL